MLIKVFASGTNVQRLAKGAGRADGVVYTAYSQLEQKEENIVTRKFWITEVASLKEAVEALDEKVQPNWTKIWGRPNSNKAFLNKWFASLAGYDTERAEINLSSMTGDDISVFMVHTSANRKEMGQAAAIARKACPEHDIVVLNGEYTSNREAESITKAAIGVAQRENRHGVIIISNTMGSRSYSISEIQASVIAFDRGSVDATGQKVARPFTPGVTFTGETKEFGHIIDMSFDPNRSENIEQLILEEAIVLDRSGEVEDFEKGVKYFFTSADVFRVGEYGWVSEVTEQDMFDVFGDNESMLRVADVTADITKMSNDILDALSNVTADAKTAKAAKAIIGKNSKTGITKGGEVKDLEYSDSEAKALQKMVNAAIRSLNRSATSVYFLAQSGNSYRECLEIIETSTNVAEFTELFGISPTQAIELVDNNVLNTVILDVVVQNSKKPVDNQGFLL